MYFICETQTQKDGSAAHLMQTAPTMNEAESKYHQILAAAAISSVPIHACIVFDEKGYTQMSKFYEHEQEAGE